MTCFFYWTNNRPDINNSQIKNVKEEIERINNNQVAILDDNRAKIISDLKVELFKGTKFVERNWR